MQLSRSHSGGSTETMGARLSMLLSPAKRMAAGDADSDPIMKLRQAALTFHQTPAIFQHSGAKEVDNEKVRDPGIQALSLHRSSNSSSVLSFELYTSAGQAFSKIHHSQRVRGVHEKQAQVPWYKLPDQLTQVPVAALQSSPRPCFQNTVVS